MKRSLMNLATLVATTAVAAASSRCLTRTDFTAEGIARTGKKLLNVKGLDANEHGGGSGGVANEATKKVTPDGNGDSVKSAGVEKGYLARNLAQAAARQLQQQQGQTA